MTKLQDFLNLMANDDIAFIQPTKQTWGFGRMRLMIRTLITRTGISSEFLTWKVNLIL